MPGIYNFCWYFLTFSFIGWVLESLLVSFQQKKFVNRGFLTGPICPIYGTAMCIIVAALSVVKMLVFRGEGSWAYGIPILLVISAFIACAVEYFVGWLLEKMFHQRWWDYSDHRFNLNGRIAIPESLAWGPLATLAMLYYVPWLDGLIERLPLALGISMLSVIAVMAIADSVLILGKMHTFDKLAASLRVKVEEYRERRAVNAEELRRVTHEFHEKLERSRKRYSERRLRRERWIRRRLSMAYPKLGERWKIFHEGKDSDNSDE